MEESIDGRTEPDQLLLNGFGVFSEKYSGAYKTSEIIGIFNTLIKEDLSNLYKDIRKYDDNKLEKYYNENADSIRLKFGKATLEEFKIFAKDLQNTSVDLNKWYSIEINKESFIDISDKRSYAYVEFKLILEDETTVEFTAYISKYTNTKPTVILNVK